MFATPHYSFGPFVFDARGRVLYRNEKDMRLPPKAAETLSVLLANAGVKTGVSVAAPKPERAK